jgi:Na+-transporting NADH:ubiquinone oxidoreductase subunit C
MPEANAAKPGRSRDSMGNTLLVAVGVSLLCSILVASAAILLKPQQIENADRYRQRIILEVAGLYEPGADIGKLWSRIQEQTVKVGSGEDKTVYLVMDGDKIERVVLPIEGTGLWGMMYGFLAVEGDGRTAYDIRFYEHQETPGLGAAVDNPSWQAKWHGKHLFDERGNPQIRIVKGKAPPDSDYQIDGLAGATLTGRGVQGFVQRWLGKEGFGPFLRRLQRAQRQHED